MSTKGTDDGEACGSLIDRRHQGIRLMSEIRLERHFDGMN